MTQVLDEYDVWTEDAYEYIRDQLRVDAVVGLSGSEGVKQIEVGQPPLGDIAEHPDALPVVWIEPERSPVQRQGSVLQHSIRVVIHGFSEGGGYVANWADRQKRHRQFAGRLYNRVDYLHAAGYAAGMWSDWEPNGEIVPEAADVGGRVIFHTLIPFRLTVDVVRQVGV